MRRVAPVVLHCSERVEASSAETFAPASVSHLAYGFPTNLARTLLPRFPRSAGRFFPALLSLALALPVAAQQADVASPKTMHAVPVPTAVAAEKVGHITVDGRLDEEGWSKATPITDFTQVDPD